MNLKNSILLSCAIHCSVIVPSFYAMTPDNPLEHHKPIEVEYIVIRERQQIDVEKRLHQLKHIETPRIKLNDKVAVKTPVIQQDITKREARVKSTKEYISYYQLLREKIRRRLKSNYVNYYKEGEVACVFTLNSKGSLVSVEVEKQKSTADKKLQNIAAASIKESSPFAPFPKEVNLPKMSFNLTISFKKQ